MTNHQTTMTRTSMREGAAHVTTSSVIDLTNNQQPTFTQQVFEKMLLVSSGIKFGPYNGFMFWCMHREHGHI